jgi:hypothetical protein
MNGPALEQRCWNHEHREAVCRCPECGRAFCRECVSEHEARLLCAACLDTEAGAARGRRGPMRRMAPLFLALAGVLLGWAICYAAGRTVMLIAGGMEAAAWNR